MDDFCGDAGRPARAGRTGLGGPRLVRGDLVKRGALAGITVAGGVAVLASWPRAASSAPSPALDERIFRFALELEYLQAAFYAAAVEAGALRGDVLDFARTVGDHEQQHVDFLRRALGRRARGAPTFDFGDAVRDRRRFLATAVLLENTGVAAYNGQAANLTKKALAAAAEIVSVEGRHAAWASALAGQEPAPRAADPGATAEAVAATIRRTGFVR